MTAGPVRPPLADWGNQTQQRWPPPQQPLPQPDATALPCSLRGVDSDASTPAQRSDETGTHSSLDPFAVNRPPAADMTSQPQPPTAPASAPADHYSRLNVAYDASTADIAAAFRRQARAMHPDKIVHQQQASGVGGAISEFDRRAASARFCALQQSYAVLSNEHSRAQYDQALKAGGLVARFTGGSSSSLPSSSAFAGVLSCTEVDLDDLEFSETADGEGLYSHVCRCGSSIVASERELESGIDLFPCPQCSIVIRVAFEWMPPEGQEQTQEEDSADGSGAPSAANATASDVRQMD